MMKYMSLLCVFRAKDGYPVLAAPRVRPVGCVFAFLYTLVDKSIRLRIMN